MQQFKKLNLLALSVFVAVILGASSIVGAEQGSGSSSGSSGGDDQVSQTDDTSSDNETETHASTEIEQNHPELHKRGVNFVNKMRELESEHDKQKSPEERKHACETHKQGIERKFNRIVNNANRMQTRIGKFLDKAVAYKTDKNVTVDNWDALVAAAETAKQTSADSLTSLAAVVPSIDCNSTSVASDIATFKAAASTARDNLKAYKQAVKNVFIALEQAKDSTDNTSEGSQG